MCVLHTLISPHKKIGLLCGCKIQNIVHLNTRHINCIDFFLNNFIYNNCLDSYDFIFDNIIDILKILFNNEIEQFLIFIIKLIEDSESNIIIRKKFFMNIKNLINHFDKTNYNKLIFDKLFSFFENNICTNIRIDFVKNLSTILIEMEKLNNIEFFITFNNNLIFIDSFISSLNDWRSLVNFIYSLNSLSCIHKLSSATTYFIIDLIKKYICYDNYQVISEIIKLCVKMLRSKLKDLILEYINDEFYKNNSYYKKRFYNIFIDNVMREFSSTFLLKTGIIDNIINILDDKNL